MKRSLFLSIIISSFLFRFGFYISLSRLESSIVWTIETRVNEVGVCSQFSFHLNFLNHAFELLSSFFLFSLVKCWSCRNEIVDKRMLNHCDAHSIRHIRPLIKTIITFLVQTKCCQMVRHTKQKIVREKLFEWIALLVCFNHMYYKTDALCYKCVCAAVFFFLLPIDVVVYLLHFRGQLDTRHKRSEDLVHGKWKSEFDFWLKWNLFNLTSSKNVLRDTVTASHFGIVSMSERANTR